MDHSPIRQTFEVGKFISTAGESIINLVKLGSLVEKYRKMWKYSHVKFANFVYFCIMRGKALPLFEMPYILYCANLYPYNIVFIFGFEKLHYMCAMPSAQPLVNCSFIQTAGTQEVL